MDALFIQIILKCRYITASNIVPWKVPTVDHRLNGSSSPVLTATSLSYGKAKNSTPTESKPLMRLRQNLAWLITSAKGPVMRNFIQIPQGGLPGKWVKYTQKFL